MEVVQMDMGDCLSNHAATDFSGFGRMIADRTLVSRMIIRRRTVV